MFLQTKNNNKQENLSLAQIIAEKPLKVLQKRRRRWVITVVGRKEFIAQRVYEKGFDSFIIA